jgi:hypothetical protein
MKPSEVSVKLRQIATAIDNSNNPRRDLVARDLGLLVSRIATSDAEAWVRDNLYKGPVYNKIYKLRSGYPDIADKIDQIVVALKEFGDKVTEKLEGTEEFAPATVREPEAERGGWYGEYLTR